MKLAIHVGFAGGRTLFPRICSQEQREQADRAVLAQLCVLLKELRTRLSLSDQHFLVGISQIAIGADSLFADACAAEHIPLRIFLPQTRDVYLHASGSQGPDFDEPARSKAQAQLDHPNVIEEAVVSLSSNRHTRFSECNVEIARHADVLISLQKSNREVGKAGGTDELVALAKKYRKPLLAIEVDIVNDEPKLTADWQGFDSFKAPTTPTALSNAKIRDEHWLDDLKNHGSAEAEAQRKLFERRSKIVVWAHVSATAVAAAALAITYAKATGHAGLGIAYPAVPVLLVIELLLLAWGWYTHHTLHHDSTTHSWAEVRLVTEIARSAQAFVSRAGANSASMTAQHTPLYHLLDLPLPESFKPLMQTINVRHLQQSREHRHLSWQEARTRYLAERIDKPKKGQLAYYTGEAHKAHEAMHSAHRGFMIFTVIAILATALKLTLTALGIKQVDIAALLSLAAISLPVLAVAVMSISASLDKQARASTYQEMRDFLLEQKQQIENAASEPEFLRLQAETELRLLGEVVNWYHRRRFVNPA